MHAKSQWGASWRLNALTALSPNLLGAVKSKPRLLYVAYLHWSAGQVVGHLDGARTLKPVANKACQSVWAEFSINFTRAARLPPPWLARTC